MKLKLIDTAEVNSMWYEWEYISFLYHNQTNKENYHLMKIWICLKLSIGTQEFPSFSLLRWVQTYFENWSIWYALYLLSQCFIWYISKLLTKSAALCPTVEFSWEFVDSVTVGTKSKSSNCINTYYIRSTFEHTFRTSIKM